MENLEDSKDHEKAEPEKSEDNSEEKSKAYNEQQKPEERKATSESIMAPQFSPPGEFSFKPKDWPSWIQRFNRYRRAVKLDCEDEVRQIDALLYAMGEKSENLFESLRLTTEQRKKYDQVVKKFTDHFIPQRNIIHERSKFHSAVQGSKSIEEFERELHSLAKYCEFKDVDDQIRDRFVLGLCDVDVQSRLHLETDLTLDKAIQIAKQYEQIQDHMASSKTTHEVRYKQQRQMKEEPQQMSSQHGGHQRQCDRCGYQHAKSYRCPATGKTCNNCKGRGHFAKMCRKAKTHEVLHGSYGAQQEKHCDEDVDGETETICIDSVDIEDNCAPWFETLMCCGSPVKFKLDTGADVTVMSDKTYSQMKIRPRLHSTRLTLRSASGKLSVKGQFKARITWRGEEYTINVIVVTEPLRNNLLSRTVSRDLGLVRRVEELTDTQNVQKIGLIKTEPVKIMLREDAKPYSVHTARNVGFNLMKSVKAELDKMVQQNIIEPVEVPSEWCAPMVPVVKPSGKIRITVDYKHLNQVVIRPYINLPNLDDLAPKLVGACVFSTMDANSGFHQVPLHDDSKLLTTFITPFGRFCY